MIISRLRIKEIDDKTFVTALVTLQQREKEIFFDLQ